MDPVRAEARRISDRTLCVDVDDTICFTKGFDYTTSTPNDPVVEKLRQAHNNGWRIVLYTARGQGRSGGTIETVADDIHREISDFCERFDVPFDAIVVGKPLARWYVDDKAVRPDEFVHLDLT
jgi:capsule biosynthesis phosphatase